MVVDEFGRTPLHYVPVDLPADRHASETQRLIDEGCDPDLQDRKGWTALHFAAQARSTDAARVLITAGANVELTDSFGNAPLFRAVFCARGEVGVVRLLLEAGADPNRKNKNGVSPLSFAETIGDAGLLTLFR